MNTARIPALLLAHSLCLWLSAQVKVVSHRGYWRAEGSAQNSIASLAKADSIGAYASEFDVWLTADDSLVVNHDKIFKGVDIPNETCSNIRKVKLDNGETIPTLGEYLAEAGRHPLLRLVLELKSLNDVKREQIAVTKIAQLLTAYELIARTSLISFSLNACKLFKSALPECEILYVKGDLAPNEVHTLGLSGIDYSGKTLKEHPEWIKEAHDLGMKVNVWTIDNPVQMKMALDAGVDYLTTNEPVTALEIYHNNNTHLQKDKRQ